MSETVWVSRDGGGAITGVFGLKQEGIAEEALLDNNPAVVSFLASISSVPLAEQARRDALRADALRADLIAKLNAATPASINTFVDNNVANLADARLMFKKILLILATDGRT